MQKVIMAFVIAFALVSFKFQLALAEAMPTPVPNKLGMGSIGCDKNNENCLKKTNAGYLLPYFGTETKVIFRNSGSNGVNINLMIGTNPNLITTADNPEKMPPKKQIVDVRFAWFVVVTDIVDDVGRFNHIYEKGKDPRLSVDNDLPKIVMERLSPCTDPKNRGECLGSLPPDDRVPSIFGIWETLWTTLRLDVPRGYSVWMVRVRMLNNDDFKIQPTTEDSYHFRYWLLSVDDY